MRNTWQTKKQLSSKIILINGSSNKKLIDKIRKIMNLKLIILIMINSSYNRREDSIINLLISLNESNFFI